MLIVFVDILIEDLDIVLLFVLHLICLFEIFAMLIMMIRPDRGF